MVEGRLVEDEDVGERCADEVKNDTKEPGGGVSAGFSPSLTHAYQTSKKSSMNWRCVLSLAH